MHSIGKQGCFDPQVLSASSAGCRIWNPRTGACIRGIECGYGLCAVWAPGNRHVVVGTKVRCSGNSVKLGAQAGTVSTSQLESMSAVVLESTLWHPRTRCQA